MTDPDSLPPIALPPTSGIALRRAVTGYLWQIYVRAESSDLDALRAAVETARTIDQELVELYGPLRPRRRRRKAKPKTKPAPVVHVPSPELGRDDNPFTDAAGEAAGRSTP
jgi:hypothetical protein